MIFLTLHAVLAGRRRASLTPQMLRGQPPRFAAEQMHAQLRHAIAPDGERIPYFVVARRDAPHDGQRPTLLYGYGGFAVPMTLFTWRAGPPVAGTRRVFVLSCIRGGGEFGPDWHEAALAERRQVAFDDFLAIARQLIADGVTCPARLGIQGGSNGGLLVAAAMTQAPELFGAVVCEVPLTDMLRYTELSAGPSWIDEYGDPADLSTTPRWRPIRPTSTCKAGVRYPATLVTTSSSDDRVHPGHARKFTARLGELGQPVLLYQSDAGGHSGQGGDMRQLAAEVARVTVFLSTADGCRLMKIVICPDSFKEACRPTPPPRRLPRRARAVAGCGCVPAAGRRRRRHAGCAGQRHWRPVAAPHRARPAGRAGRCAFCRAGRR